MAFDKNNFCDEHREWEYLREYLEDRPTQEWTIFSINDEKNNEKNKNKNKTKSSKKNKKNKTRKYIFEKSDE
jgi:hypothetical protein